MEFTMLFSKYQAKTINRFLFLNQRPNKNTKQYNRKLFKSFYELEAK